MVDPPLQSHLGRLGLEMLQGHSSGPCHHWGAHTQPALLSPETHPAQDSPLALPGPGPHSLQLEELDVQALPLKDEPEKLSDLFAVTTSKVGRSET